MFCSSTTSVQQTVAPPPSRDRHHRIGGGGDAHHHHHQKRRPAHHSSSLKFDHLVVRIRQDLSTAGATFRRVPCNGVTTVVTRSQPPTTPCITFCPLGEEEDLRQPVHQLCRRRRHSSSSSSRRHLQALKEVQQEQESLLQGSATDNEKSSPLAKKFTVQFVSRSTQRKAVSPATTPPIGINSVPEKTSSVDTMDSNMNSSDQQKAFDHVASQRLHDANMQAFEAVLRRPEDEVHYLKSLVYSGLLYQRQKGRLQAFASKICGVSSLTAVQALDLSFVARTMCLDVEELLPTLGYSKTLKALMDLKLW